MYGKRKNIGDRQTVEILVRFIPAEVYLRISALAEKQGKYMNKMYNEVLAAGTAHKEREQRIMEENEVDY